MPRLKAALKEKKILLYFNAIFTYIKMIICKCYHSTAVFMNLWLMSNLVLMKRMAGYEVTAVIAQRLWDNKIIPCVADLLDLSTFRYLV